MTDLALNCRRLFLRNHTVDVRIGAHDFEKLGPQRIVFNVELFVPYSASTPTQDDLAEVVDYDFTEATVLALIPTSSMPAAWETNTDATAR